jgi:hypothetical protein
MDKNFCLCRLVFILLGSFYPTRDWIGQKSLSSLLTFVEDGDGHKLGSMNLGEFLTKTKMVKKFGLCRLVFILLGSFYPTRDWIGQKSLSRFCPCKAELWCTAGEKSTFVEDGYGHKLGSMNLGEFLTKTKMVKKFGLCRLVFILLGSFYPTRDWIGQKSLSRYCPFKAVRTAGEKSAFVEDGDGHKLWSISANFWTKRKWSKNSVFVSFYPSRSKKPLTLLSL